MTAKTKTEIKAFFQTGDQPTESQFIDLIDSYTDASGPVGQIEAAASAGSQGFAFCSAGRGEVIGGAAALTFQGITVYTTALAQSAVQGAYSTTAQAAAGTNATTFLNPVLARAAIEAFAVRSVTTGITGADQITNAVSLTSAEYAAVSAMATTLYIITDA